ncbi:MAG: AAA family ATPase [Patescibacteria group bacterium]
MDTAIGGATNRNHIVDINDLSISVDAVDTYTTMFRFQQEYKEHVELTGSVRGADRFVVWSDFLWFDIDALDVSDATLNMQTLLRGFKSMGVLEHVVVFFSGSKGYHIGVDAGVFGFEPSQTLPDQMRRTAVQIASLFNIDLLDVKVYNHNRLWRVVDTIHGKTQLRKTALDPSKAINMTVDEIKRAASSGKSRRRPRHIVCDNAESVETLVRLAREASAGVVKKSANWDAPPLSDRRAKLINAGLSYLLEHGVAKGTRDNEALLRASECRKVGIEKNECLAKLNGWNALNHPPLTDDDLQRVVDSAYTGPGYDFGTNHDSLRMARIQGERTMEEINVDKLLNDDQSSDEEEKIVKRPYTLAEILAGGYEPQPLEVVGEWFSWRKRITLVVGREKYSGKSTLCTFEAMAAMKRGLRVMWISPDEPQEDIVYRFVKAGAPTYSTQLFIVGDAMVPSSWKQLAQFVADVRPDLIILDSIHSLFPLLSEKGTVPDSSESAAWQKLVSCLRPLAIAIDAAVVWIHHANKATSLSSGSIGITAGVDIIINVGTSRKDNRRTLQYLGRRVSAKMNCALDYLGEEQGYERVKDWSQEAQHMKDEKSKTEMARDWVTEFIAQHKGDEFTAAESDAAYLAQFNEDPKKGDMMKKARAWACDVGLCRLPKTRRMVDGKPTAFYQILRRDLPTTTNDLLDEADDV